MLTSLVPSTKDILKDIQNLEESKDGRVGNKEEQQPVNNYALIYGCGIGERFAADSHFA